MFCYEFKILQFKTLIMYANHLNHVPFEGFTILLLVSLLLLIGVVIGY